MIESELTEILSPRDAPVVTTGRSGLGLYRISLPMQASPLTDGGRLQFMASNPVSNTGAKP